MMIARVRRMLSAIEMERYGKPKLRPVVFQALSGCEVW